MIEAKNEIFHKEACLDYMSKHMLPTLFSKNIGVHFIPKDRIPSGLTRECSGFFSSQNKEIKIATGKKFHMWFPIFLHEYNHFIQWHTKDPAWTSNVKIYYGNKRINTMAPIEDHLRKLNVPNDLLTKSCEKSFNLERDCENKTISIINKQNLGIDTKWYTRAANSYLLIYVSILKDQKWCNKSSPGRVEDAVKNMPHDHLFSWDEAMNFYPQVRDIYLEKIL